MVLVVLAAGCGGERGEAWLRSASAREGMRAADSDSGYVPPAPIDPIAMGFVFQSGLRSDGSLSPVRAAPGADPYGPVMSIGFAGRPYFYDGVETDLCWVQGTFAPPERACDLPTDDGADLWRSYEGTFEVVANGCAGRFDPAVWGPGGTDLIAAIDGMHLGVGFGPMTPFLEDAWSPETLAEWSDNFFAMYVAIHHPDGTFVGQDWDSAVLWAWDEQTGLLLTDGYGNPTPLETAAFPVGALPAGYIETYAAWFEDFPLIDFGLLDLPGASDPCPGETGATGDTGGTATGDTGGTDSPPPPTDGSTTYDESVVPNPTDDGGSSGGCGCAHGGSRSAGVAGLAALIAGLRRRRGARVPTWYNLRRG